MKPDYKGIVKAILDYLHLHKWQARKLVLGLSIALAGGGLAAFILSITYAVIKYNGL